MTTVLITSSDKSRCENWQKLLAENVNVQQVVIEETFQKLSRIKPDLCLVDVDSLHTVDKTEIINLVGSQHETSFIIFVAIPDADDGFAWIRAGAKGYVNRLSHANVMQAVIETVEHGEIWAGRQVVQQLLQNLQLTPEITNDVQFEKLTDREHELALLIGSGLSNNQVADRLAVKERTVKAHLSNIFKKLKIKSRVQLALLIKQESPRQTKKSVG